MTRESERSHDKSCPNIKGETLGPSNLVRSQSRRECRVSSSYQFIEFVPVEVQALIITTLRLPLQFCAFRKRGNGSILLDPRCIRFCGCIVTSCTSAVMKLIMMVMLLVMAC